MRTFITLLLFCGAFTLRAQNTIYAYAVADWREGPVMMSSVFETTEAFTDAMLNDRVKREYTEFKEKAEIVIKRFATLEEAAEDQHTLVLKYHSRGVLATVYPSIKEKKEAAKPEEKAPAPKQ